MSLASPTPRHLWRACCDKRDLFSCCGSHLRPGVAKSKTGELLLLLQGQSNSHSGYPGYTIEQDPCPLTLLRCYIEEPFLDQPSCSAEIVFAEESHVWIEVPR